MATRLFVIHGMGVFGEDWVTPVETLLDEIYAKYPRLAKVPRKQRFTIEPIRYDDIISSLVERWQTDATTISTLSKDVGAEVAAGLVGWLKTAGDGFEWTHAADVLLYRCFSDVREAVQVAVGLQIAQRVNEDKESDSHSRWGVLAHSLGTAVAHDTLHALWTSKLPDGSETGWDPKRVKAAFVMMVANVSRVLQTEVNALDSVVRPGRPTNKRTGCINLVTVRHALDPFTIPQMFDPEQWPDAATVEERFYQSIRVNHFRGRNVHGFRHYLQHPAVHIPLMRLLANNSTVITVKEEKDALAAFPDFGNLPENTVKAELKRLELMQPARSDTWLKLRPIWDAFFGA